MGKLEGYFTLVTGAGAGVEHRLAPQPPNFGVNS